MSPKQTSRLTAILVALAGCGSDPPSGVDHSLTTCDISTGSNAGMPCERACATHRDETDIDCQAHSSDSALATIASALPAPRKSVSWRSPNVGRWIATPSSRRWC